jgi:hypothetical protein
MFVADELGGLDPRRKIAVDEVDVVEVNDSCIECRVYTMAGARWRMLLFLIWR